MLIHEANKYFQAGAYETAVNRYEHLLQKEPLNHLYWQRFARLSPLLSTNLKKPAKAYRQAVTLDSTDIHSYWNGAVAFSKINNQLLAKLYLREALNLDPSLRPINILARAKFAQIQKRRDILGSRREEMSKKKSNNSIYRKDGKLKNSFYEKELARLQEELVRLQYWVKEQGLRVVILFEGRDAAGKGWRH